MKEYIIEIEKDNEEEFYHIQNILFKMGFTWLDNTQYYFQGKNIFNNQCLSYFIIMNKDRTIGTDKDANH